MAITIVQSTKSTSASATFASNTTAGNCLVVCYASYLGTSSPNVTAVKIGGAADNFTMAASQIVSGIGGFEYAGVWIWYDWNCVGGQQAVAVSGANLMNSSAGGTFIYEVAGLMNTAAVIDQTNNGGAVSGTPYTSGSITTTNPNEIVFGVTEGGGSVGSPSGFTIQTETDTNGGYAILTSTGSKTYTGTNSSSFYATCIASFQAPLAPPQKVVQVNQAVMRAAIW